MRSHQAWLVDLDGTLYHPGPLKVAMATELLLFGVHHAPLLRRFRHEHERLRGGGTGSYPNPYAAQVGRTAEACGKSTEAVERIVREWMQERPGKWIYRFRRTGLLRQIAAYRAAGGKTAVVAGDEFVHDPFWRASLSRRVQFGLVRVALRGRGVGQQSGGAEWRPR